jgi:hypothetical protein
MERNDVVTGSGAAPATSDRRQFVLRGAALGVMFTGSSTLLSACGGGTSLATTTDGITFGADTPGSLDPAFAQYYADLMAINAEYEGLIRYKPGTYEVVDQLAETSNPHSSASGDTGRPGRHRHQGVDRLAGSRRRGHWPQLDEVEQPGVRPPQRPGGPRARQCQTRRAHIGMQRIWDGNANAVWPAWPATTWSADKDIAMTIRPDGLPTVQAFHAA